MSTLLLHDQTAHEMELYVAEPAHGLLITGAKGSGKATIAHILTGQALTGGELDTEHYENHAQIRIIRPIDGKYIPIETIRELQHFLSLSVPGTKPADVNRAVVIEDAHTMTTEAQNALLKTLEEPPAGTVLLLTAPTFESVLPTIQSRVRQLVVRPPRADQVRAYFTGRGFDADTIDKALLISGGLPGLTAALLAEDETHPLILALTHARGILQSKTYDRLVLVDGLSKQKQLCIDVLYVIGRMSRMALARTADPAATARWTRILHAAYDAERQLGRSVQAKLVLTNFMLML